MDRKNVYLFGKNSISRMLVGYLRDDSQYFLSGITVNGEYCDTKEYCGFPLIPFEDLVQMSCDFGVINCVGYSEQLGTRAKIDNLIKNNQIPLFSYFHPKAELLNVALGEGNILLGNAVIEQYSTVGNGNVFYGGSYICHDAIIGDYNWFSAQTVLAGEIKVGSRNFFGINSSIKERISVGSMITIGAGAVVICDIPDYSVAVGNPAVVKKNDIQN